MSTVIDPGAEGQSCTALDRHISTLRSFVSSTRKFHGECSVSCRPGCAMDVDAAEAIASVLAELERLRNSAPEALWEGLAHKLIVTGLPEPFSRSDSGLRSLHAVAHIDSRRPVRVIAVPSDGEPSP